MADLVSVANLLKEVWRPPLETAFASEIVALARIERTSDGFSTDGLARYVVMPMKVTRSQGIGSRGERVPLPKPGQQGWHASRVRVRTQYAVGDITVQALELANNDASAFVRTLEQEQSGLRDDAIYDYARQVYGNGSGVLGAVTVVTGNVLTVDRIQYFQRKMILDIVSADGLTVRNSGDLEVSDIDVDAKTVTVTGNVGAPVATDVLVRRGDYGQEITGLDAIIDDDTELQQVDPAVIPEWAAYVDSGSAADYSEIRIMKAFDQNRRRASKAPSVMFTGLGVQKGIYESLVSDRRFVNSIEFAHGFTGLPFNYGGRQIPIVDDPMFPEDFAATTGQIWGVCEDTLKLFRHSDGWHYAEETGSMFIPAGDRSDAWEFRLRQHSQLGTSMRNTHFRILNVNTA